MKISYNWLKDYIDVPWNWEELVERLTMAGLELEDAVDQQALFNGIVVGHVNIVEKHPNADRLRVCTVDIGDSTATIVCGAPNVAAGQLVPVCLPGKQLPDGTKIEETVIRGIQSSGMICSEAELGIGEDVSGILVIDAAATHGEPFAKQSGLDDIEIDFEVTPNRPDCLSIFGIAREVRALSGVELRPPTVALKEVGAAATDEVEIQVLASSMCPRYCARVVRNVELRPSPDWLTRRLNAVGLRPINNVVDITNYVLMELGHPLHAFDLDKLEGRRVLVRTAQDGEQVETLDGVTRALTPEILVIADAQKPIAVAGIMGGSNTEVADDTTNVLLESAYFHPGTVRNGRAILSMQSEASMRFERGADYHATSMALDRAAGLIADLCSGQVAPGMIDISVDFAPTRVDARLSRIRNLLSVNFEASRVVEILELLGCQVEIEADVLHVRVPSFRPDLQREVDLVEEVGRIHGYDRIESSTMITAPISFALNSNDAQQREIRQRLSGLGLDEVITNSIVDDTFLEFFDTSVDGPLTLSNPPTEDQSILRPSLVGSLLDVARRNFNQRADSVAIFEIGKCYYSIDEDYEVSEQMRLAGLWSGGASKSTWRRDQRDVDFLDLKGVVEILLADLNCEFSPAHVSWLRPGFAAAVTFQREELGFVGEVEPRLCLAFDIERKVFIFDLDFDHLASLRSDTKSNYYPLPRFPPIERDLAVVVSTDVSNGEVEFQILDSAPDLIETVELFDVYQGDQIPPNRKSLAYAIRLRSPEKTLADAEADAVMKTVLKNLEKSLGAKLR